MASSQDNLYDCLAEDALKLRELGKTWGLSDTDIGLCFQRALGPDKKPPKSPKSRACQCFGLTMLGLVAVVVAFHCVVSFHKPSRVALMRYTQGVAYPVMRAVRLASLPLGEIFDLSGLHEMECVLPNPLAVLLMGSKEFDCWPCEEIKDVHIFRNLSNFTRFYYHSGVPLVVKDSNFSQVTFDDLKTVYLDNKLTLHPTSHRVKSSNPFIHNIEDVLTPERTIDSVMGTDLYLQWRIMKPGGIRLVRELSPKPYFVPKKAEVATEMFVLIHAPAAEAHSLPWPEHPNAWLTQAYGSQEVTLTPVSGCKANCTEVSVVLEPSDVLYYAPRFWQPSSFSYGDQLSIAFQGSFY